MKYWFRTTELEDNQFMNCKLSAAGRAVGVIGISHSTCYKDMRLETFKRERELERIFAKTTE